jgi:predicted nucleic acid-binding Zn ribbon protein
MDRRFICTDCGTKWFIHEHRVNEPDLTECGRCGARLIRLLGGFDGLDSGEGAGDLGEEDR